MNLLGIDAAIRDRLGLDPATLGLSVLPHAVEARMRARGVTTAEQYLGVLADRVEAEALAAELVVAETWFFRGGRPLFDRLADFLANRGSRAVGAPARALSLPCSTGEEPYSLAIALHEHFVPPEQFRIDAVDLSARHLDRAATARFSSFAFREAGPDIRLTHFRPAADRWDLLPHVRQLVHFRNGNVTEPSFLLGERPHDLVMCRNLFIYLTIDGRKRAMANLDRLLAHDGLLCLTPGEADRLPPGRFVSEGPPEFGIYRRNGPASGVIPRSEIAQAAAALASVPVEKPVVLPAKVQETTNAASLEYARGLADAGRLGEARAACERLVSAKIALPDTYTLLGAIHQAEGRTADAAEAFRRALYLAPGHREALSHMIVICDRKGDSMQATAFRKRLARAGETT